ncbi:MAG: hypothetical protein LBB63_01770 [Holosporaceae bacterium]|nr:hypothetical protein [Holosporaceae bacterium]
MQIKKAVSLILFVFGAYIATMTSAFAANPPLRVLRVGSAPHIQSDITNKALRDGRYRGEIGRLNLEISHISNEVDLVPLWWLGRIRPPYKYCYVRMDFRRRDLASALRKELILRAKIRPDNIRIMPSLLVDSNFPEDRDRAEEIDDSGENHGIFDLIITDTSTSKFFDAGTEGFNGVCKSIAKLLSVKGVFIVTDTNTNATITEGVRHSNYSDTTEESWSYDDLELRKEFSIKKFLSWQDYLNGNAVDDTVDDTRKKAIAALYRFSHGTQIEGVGPYSSFFDNNDATSERREFAHGTGIIVITRIK